MKALWLFSIAFAGFGDRPIARLAVNAEDLGVYAPTAIDVDSTGSASFDLAGGSAGRVYWLIAANGEISERSNALTFERGKFRSPVRALPVQMSVVDSDWQHRTAQRRREMRLRRQPAGSDRYAAGKIPAEKSFHLFVKENDVLESEGYREVHARLAACGTHCVIYLDIDDWSQEFLMTTVAEAVDTFDTIVFPQARALFGEHVDVDRNGKFTILFTHWLGKLSDGKVSLGGFVRGADFYRDVEAPLSNRCDMLYLNTNLKPGPNLRSLLAHEYTHAITFSEHVFGRYLADANGADDEAWLSEAIAHLAENLIGQGYSNLDHRVSAFLTAPERYRLVVPDYYRAGLWRCHGCRGATYLFLRHLVDQCGNGVLMELSRSNLSGTANLEAATQRPFADLFREWCVATVLSGLDPAAKSFDYRSLDLRGRLESRQLAGPRVRVLPVGKSRFDIASTAMLPLEIRISAGGNERIEANVGSLGQLTLIRMPDDLPCVELNARETTAAGDARPVRLQVVQGAGTFVRWQNVAWELAFPPQFKAPESHTSATIMACPDLFAKFETASGQSVSSDTVDLGKHGSRSVVIKACGADAKGRRVAAWTIVGSPASSNAIAEGN